MGANNSSQICINSSDFNLVKHYKKSKFKYTKNSLNQLNQGDKLNQHNQLVLDTSDKYGQHNQYDQHDKPDQIEQIIETNQHDQIKDHTYAQIYHNILIARQLTKQTKKKKFTTDVVDIGFPKKAKKKNGLCDIKYTMKLSKKGRPLDVSPTIYEYNKFDEFIELLTKTIEDTTGITVRNNSVLFFIIKPDMLTERIFISHISINDKYAILEFEKRCIKEESFLIYKTLIKKKLTLDIRTEIMSILLYL